MRYILVRPGSRLNFSNDWADPTDPWLADGDTIASRQWTIIPMNPGTPVTPALTSDTSDTVFVEGCLSGHIYHLTEHVTTANGLQDDAPPIVLRVE